MSKIVLDTDCDGRTYGQIVLTTLETDDIKYCDKCRTELKNTGMGWYCKKCEVIGHHINDKGQFQSDKYPDIGPDKIVFSFHDALATPLLEEYAQMTPDRELGDDILDALRHITAQKK